MDKSKRFKYRILPEHKLIIESWTGEFSIAEIIYFKTLETSDPKWKDHYNVLADDRQSIKRIGPEIEGDIDEYLKLSQKFLKKHKAAILTSSPTQVVESTFMKLNKPLQALVQIETFSTIEGALQWLDINLKEIDKINEILKQMSND